MPAYPDPTPSWLKPENASVLDSWWTKLGRGLGRVIGADDPQSQVLGLMGTEIPTAKVSEIARKGIRAFHGSPHDFEQFDVSKIGTGEGAQAYGHGLYFSESPAVANTYRGKVSAMQGQKPTIGGRPINWDDPAEAAAFELWRHDGNRAAAADFYEKNFKSSDVPALLRSNQPLPKVDPPGRGYEVNIKADPDQFLDWDTPLRKQPMLAQSQAIRELNAANHFGYHMPAFKALPPEKQSELVERAPFVLGGKSGASVLAELKDSLPLSVKRSDAAAIASTTLKQAGIPGIKYLDQGSRAVGEDSRNYVVFDDSLIDILKKYGILAPTSAALARQALLQRMTTDGQQETPPRRRR